MQHTVFDADYEAFHTMVREVLAREVVPVFPGSSEVMMSIISKDLGL